MTRLEYNLDDIKDYAVEPGRHRARVTKIVQEKSKKGKPMLTWYWKIIAGSEKGSEVRSWTSMVPGALFNLKNHLEGFGHTGKVKTDTKKLVGKTAVLVIGITTSTNDDGDEREFSNVLKVLPDKKASLKNAVVEEEYDGDEAEDDEEYEDDEDEVEDDEDDEDDWEEDEEEDDDEEDEEPEPAPKRKKSKKPVPKKGKKKSRRQGRRLGEDDEPPF
jgi:hypothetical protein